MGKRVITVALFVFAAMLSTAQSARAEYLCDVKYENCRTKVLTLIRSENVGIDWTFWITEDSRYATELIKRFQAGVPVRIIMDLRANLVSPINEQTLNQLKAAGIPIRYRSVGDVAHMKMMLFAGQNWVEFSGANYNPFEYVPAVPWVNYQQESIYFTDDPSIVNSFKTRMDNVWTNNSQYTDWANVANPKTREYPTYPIDPELNFPPEDSYTSRLLPLMDAEPGSGAIQVFMFRLTDSRPVDAVIRAFTRGVDTRLIVDEAEYRNPARLDDSYNVDRMYKAGVPLRFPAHQGVNHQKSVVLSAQRTAILSSSNWSVASDDNQLEGNIFTKKSWFVQWFEDQFETAWANLHVMPDGTQAQETKPFKPLPPTKPIYNSPANAATGVGMSTTLTSCYFYSTCVIEIT